MLLKKQTVWLLTMLSLVVVLSVYYITSPEQQQNELAAVDQQEEKEQQAGETTKDNEEIAPDAKTEEAESKDAEIITNAAGDEAFETMRMQLMDERSQLKEELEKKIASTDLPAEERSEAKEQMNELNEIANKEVLLETLIKAMNYEDVLVRADDDQVNITVKAEKQSKTEANKIIQTVRSELGPLHAVVEFQNVQ
ncbi:SpoIIIAH-like family protein [Niallia sp. XMNu-256]|uniref:SpoIIIAH-like family protein n=1 Tax=Niallia sp. XMNu-256 TaxID=3082444 RepID=UPI0030D42B33